MEGDFIKKECCGQTFGHSSICRVGTTIKAEIDRVKSRPCSNCKVIQKQLDELLAAAIQKELDRHLIDANDAGTFHEHQNRAGFNKGLREAGVIIARYLRIEGR